MDSTDMNWTSRRPSPPTLLPWVRLLLVGLASGTLDRIFDDINVGTTYGIMDSLTISALWIYIRSYARDKFAGSRDCRGK